jgi:hypothetical protein
MSGSSRTHGGDEKYIQNYERETCGRPRRR